MCAGYILPLLADYCARGNKIRIPEYMLPTTVEFDAWNFGTRLNEGTTVRIQSNPIQSHVLGPSCLSFFSLQSRPRQRTRLCTPAVLDPLVSLPSRRHLLFSPLVSSQLRCHSLLHLLVLNSGATCWSLGQLSVHLSPGQGM